MANEKRLIDADAFLKDILTAGIGKTIIEYSESDIGYMIRKRPTVDVAQVKHGRWLCVDTGTEELFLCNRCKKKEYWESNYCPSCGARMDGD